MGQLIVAGGRGGKLAVPGAYSSYGLVFFRLPYQFAVSRFGAFSAERAASASEYRRRSADRAARGI